METRFACEALCATRRSVSPLSHPWNELKIPPGLFTKPPFVDLPKTPGRGPQNPVTCQNCTVCGNNYAKWQAA